MPKSFDIDPSIRMPRYEEVELSSGEKVRVFPSQSTFCSHHLHVTLERYAGTSRASREEYQLFLHDLIVALLETGEKTFGAKDH